MRLSTRARYALRMMLDVARNGGDGDPVSLANVAERTGISRGYLEQLAMALRTARLVRGVLLRARIAKDLAQARGQRERTGLLRQADLSIHDGAAGDGGGVPAPG